MCCLNLFSLSSIVSLDWILSSCDTLFNLCVDVADHLGEVINQVLLVCPCIIIPIWIIIKLLFEKVIMSILARTSVVPCVWEKIVWTESEQIEFTNFRIVKMVSIL